MPDANQGIAAEGGQQQQQQGQQQQGGQQQQQPAALDTKALFSSLSADNQAFATTKGWKPEAFDPNAVFDSYRNAEKLIGDKGALPSPRLDDEKAYNEWPGHKVLGAKDKPDEYKIAKPELPKGMEWDEGGEKVLRNAAAKYKIPERALNGLVQDLAAMRIAEFKNYETMTTANQANLDKELNAAWGPQRPAMESKAKDAYQRIGKAFGVDSERLAAGLSVAWSDAETVKFFAKLGEHMSEDVLKGGGGGGGDPTPADAQAQIEALKIDPNFQSAYNDASNAGHKEAVAKMERLHMLKSQYEAAKAG